MSGGDDGVMKSSKSGVTVQADMKAASIRA